MERIALTRAKQIQKCSFKIRGKLFYKKDIKIWREEMPPTINFLLQPCNKFINHFLMEKKKMEHFTYMEFRFCVIKNFEQTSSVNECMHELKVWLVGIPPQERLEAAH